MKTKKKYIAPTLKSYVYQVEGGFTLSINRTDDEYTYTNGIENWGGWSDPGDNGGGNFGGGTDPWNWD